MDEMNVATYGLRVYYMLRKNAYRPRSYSNDNLNRVA